MNRRTTHLLSLLIGAAALVGCQTKPYPPANEAVAVQIEANAEPGPVTPVVNRDDPREVIAFARSLSAANRHPEAAAIYLDAAKRFESVGNRFESDCRKAAVREYWLAGDLPAAHQLLNELEASQDLYARAAERESLRQLRRVLNETTHATN